MRKKLLVGLLLLLSAGVFAGGNSESSSSSNQTQKKFVVVKGSYTELTQRPTWGAYGYDANGNVTMWRSDYVIITTTGYWRETYTDGVKTNTVWIKPTQKRVASIVTSTYIDNSQKSTPKNYYQSYYTY